MIGQTLGPYEVVALLGEGPSTRRQDRDSGRSTL